MSIFCEDWTPSALRNARHFVDIDAYPVPSHPHAPPSLYGTQRKDEGMKLSVMTVHQHSTNPENYEVNIRNIHFTCTGHYCTRLQG